MDCDVLIEDADLRADLDDSEAFSAHGQFSWEKAVAETWSVYRELLVNKNA